MKELGKITSAYYGFGGYQDVMLGVSFSFEFGGSGIADFWGMWADDPSDYAKWDKEDQIKSHGETADRIAKLLSAAKVDRVEKLVGIAVEVETERNSLVGWRVLTEVL